MTEQPARTTGQRINDTVRRLEQDVDAWVATASPEGGEPCMVPLSFLWDGTTLLFSTPESSPTIRNLRASGRVRLGIGQTRDVVLIEGSAHVIPRTDLDQATGDTFATKTGFDPRGLSTEYAYFRVTPDRIQAWREANELSGRTIMRAGEWVTGDG
jgi:general stress protein 26